MPRVDLNITFDTGSWQLSPDQVDRLAAIADGLNRAMERNPREVFMIEGHTDGREGDQRRQGEHQRQGSPAAWPQAPARITSEIKWMRVNWWLFTKVSAISAKTRTPRTARKLGCMMACDAHNLTWPSNGVRYRFRQATPATLCTGRLSIITMSPRLRVGTRHRLR